MQSASACAATVQFARYPENNPTAFDVRNGQVSIHGAEGRCLVIARVYRLQRDILNSVISSKVGILIPSINYLKW